MVFIKILIIDKSNVNCIKDKFCDILVVMSGANTKNIEILTKIAIVFGDIPLKNYKNIKYDNLITYGYSRKNSATISSVTENEILISTLREIEKINGESIEICEVLYEKTKKDDLHSLALGILHLICK